MSDDGPRNPNGASSPGPRSGRGVRALEWWSRLADPENGDPGTLARLRRARTSLEALEVSAAADLARRLGAAGGDAPSWCTRGALDLARVLAHVRVHEPSKRPMRAAGWTRFAGDRRETDTGEDRPQLSEARFRRLLEVGDGEEKVAAVKRLLALLGGTVKVDALADDFMMWNNPEIGDRIRERWAFEYFAAGVAAPAAPTSDIEDDE